MGDMADWQTENMLIPDDWEDREIQREWAKREKELIRKAKEVKEQAEGGSK
jgi:hypothetical protein